LGTTSRMYVGQKGFTLPKQLLTDAELRNIKKELTFRPETFATKVMKIQTVAIKMWRENENKMYLPRFYGERRFGAVESRITEPTAINVPFQGQVRPAQIPVIETFLEKAAVFSNSRAGSERPFYRSTL